MRRFVLWLLRLLPHGCFILAFNMFVFFMLDRFNRAMVFLDNDLTKWLLAVLCLLALIESVIFAAMGTGKTSKEAAADKDGEKRVKENGAQDGKEGKTAKEEKNTAGRGKEAKQGKKCSARAGVILKSILAFSVFFLALYLFVWWLADLVTPASLRFLANGFSKWPLGVFCLLVVVQSVVYIALLRISGSRKAGKAAPGKKKAPKKQGQKQKQGQKKAS